MQLFTLKNLMVIAAIGTGSFVAVGTVSDIKSKSVQDTEEEITMYSEEVERNLASVVQTQGAKSLYLELNEINKRKINGEWEIVRHVKNNEVVFDSAKGDSAIKASMELIDISTVKVANDMEQVFQVSILEGKKIALFRKFGSNYEILEARKVEVAQELENNDIELDLVLDRVVLQENPGSVLSNGDVQGNVTVKNKEIHNLTVSVQSASGVEKNISINFAEVGDAGAFTVDVDGEEVSGIFFNNGNDGYRMSFVNGPLAGAQLNFMTEEKISQRKEEEQEKNYEQSFEQVEEEKVVVNEEKMKEEVIEASETRNQESEPVEVYSQEEVKEIAETNGFNF